MKNMKLGLFVSLIFICYAAALGDENQPPKRQLRFEVTPATVNDYKSWLEKGRMNRPEGRDIKPTHAAIFLILKDNRPKLLLATESELQDQSRPRRSGMSGFSLWSVLDEWQKTLSNNKSLSDLQHRLIRERPIYSTPDQRSGDYNEIRLFATSEADARALVENFLAFLDDMPKAKLEDEKKNLEKYHDMEDKAKTEIPELETAIKANEDKKNEMAKRLGYNQTDPAKEIIHELIPMMVKQNIEINGLEARVNALKKFMGQGTEKTQELTHQMLIAQEVELAAAQAKDEQMMTARRSAQDFINLFAEGNDLYSKLQKQKNLQKNAEERIASFEQSIENLSAEMRPAEVFENKVEISVAPKE
jgi:hypothetical protein